MPSDGMMYVLAIQNQPESGSECEEVVWCRSSSESEASRAAISSLETVRAASFDSSYKRKRVVKRWRKMRVWLPRRGVQTCARNYTRVFRHV